MDHGWWWRYVNALMLGCREVRFPRHFFTMVTMVYNGLHHSSSSSPGSWDWTHNGYFVGHSPTISSITFCICLMASTVTLRVPASPVKRLTSPPVPTDAWTPDSAGLERLNCEGLPDSNMSRKKTKVCQLTCKSQCVDNNSCNFCSWKEAATS